MRARRERKFSLLFEAAQNRDEQTYLPIEIDTINNNGSRYLFIYSGE